MTLSLLLSDNIRNVNMLFLPRLLIYRQDQIKLLTRFPELFTNAK